MVCFLVGCLFNVPATCNVSQGRICSPNGSCCHTETGVADHTFYLTQSQCTDTWPTSLSVDIYNTRRRVEFPLGCQISSHWCDSTCKKRESNPGLRLLRRAPTAVRAGRLFASSRGAMAESWEESKKHYIVKYNF